MGSEKFNVALIGNPNIGKTTLFNALCGLNQKTGNYPGVTVSKVRGQFKHQNREVEVIDLPGVDSIYPKSEDERVVYRFLCEQDQANLPDQLVVVVSALNFKRNLYLFHQIRDLEMPVVLVVNMIDVAAKQGIHIDVEALSSAVGCPVYPVSAKTGEGVERLKSGILKPVKPSQATISHYCADIAEDSLKQFAQSNGFTTPYHAFLDLIYHKKDDEVKALSQATIGAHKLRVNEAILRYKAINTYLGQVYEKDEANATDLTSKLDGWFMHPVWGYAIFILIMFTVFQSIFSLATYPMDWIDAGTAFVADWVKALLPSGYLSDLITDGLIPGIGGVVIFVPQIAILFFFFSLLEESGYMTRIVFLTDKLMQRFGMSGKSVLPLISGFACAIPSIMTARTIENRKERLITIMVAPLLTCSARLPVYVILISLVVPETYYGPFGLQGLAMLAMYLIGILAALISAWVFKLILKNDVKSHLIVEMPRYLLPSLKNIGIRVWKNASAFVTNAGKIIIATSIILFVLATNGGSQFKNAEEIVQQANPTLNEEEMAVQVASHQLEYSYLGQIGRTIEPVIKPLGYDWKIGIAIISSLAAREVFVGTMAIIYNINSEEETTIKAKMAKEVNRNTGQLTFNFATAMSLLLFYAFALQCFSTVAVTYKETKSVKWTAIQFLYMSVFAYLAALVAYQLLI